MDSQRTPSAHLPGRLNSLTEYEQALPAIQHVTNMLARLKTQAFVLKLRQLFEEVPRLQEIQLESGPEGIMLVTTDQEECQADIEDLSDQIQDLELPYDVLASFETESPIQRSSFTEQIKSAYENGLTSSQQEKGGRWASFWGNLPLIEGDQSEDENDEDELEPED